MPESMTTDSRSVLLGIVPVSMQTPPTHRRRSMTAARLPSFAGLHGGALTRRPAAHGDQIEVEARAHRPPLVVNPMFRDIAYRRYGGTPGQR
jgi:hypothetical protein